MPIFDRYPRLSAFLTLVILATGHSAFADGTTGEQIYRKQCATCHGKTGEGSEDFPRALVGDRSVPQLARLIEKTMPEDDPGTCVGDDARAVAAFIFDSFYSQAAQSKNKPPRIELSRLTVKQYRNAVADLIGTFRGEGKWDEKRGLTGEYFKSNEIWDKKQRVIERLDPEIRFDFGVDGPEPEKFKPHRFSIKWSGGLLAPETGDYEFIVRSEHAVKLWVKDMQAPLIDAWVRSGNDTEHRGTIRLDGGRPYVIQLEFSKSKMGVDDEKDKKKEPPKVPASIALLWKLPHRTAEVIPARNLSPGWFPDAFVCSTPFPPDDRSVGYERGTSISKAWDAATTDAAIEVAGYVASNLKSLAKVGDSDGDRADKLRKFCLDFAERAFRRPLTDEQKATFVNRQFEGRDPLVALKRSILLILKSPRFLYREAVGADAFAVASRLSFALWDAPPDGELYSAAINGQLTNREQVSRQAERMIGNLRAKSKLRDFFLQWLRVDQVPDLAKDPKAFPGFDEVVASDLRTSLDLFLDDVVWSDSSDFRQLLLADTVFLNGRLSQFYGGDLSTDAPFQKVGLDAKERAGVLSHPYLMASFAYTSTSSPIHRGVFLSRSVLGRALRPPPEAVAPLAPELHAGLSTRERVALQTKAAACNTCHGMINPLGFGLERFDAVGRFRAEEKGRPVDASGSYEPPSGDLTPYTGARELAAVLAASSETHSAFVEQLFHHLVKQPIRAYGPKAAGELKKSFASNGYNIRKLAVEIAVMAAYPPPPEPPKIARKPRPSELPESLFRRD